MFLFSNFQYYGLQILENVIKTRWKILPRNQCEGRKMFQRIVNSELKFFGIFIIVEYWTGWLWFKSSVV